MNLENAIVYDVETLPNVFMLCAMGLSGGDLDLTFQISPWQNDAATLWHWLNHWRDNQTPMIGFNNVAFDYPIIHHLFLNPTASPAELFDLAQTLINQRWSSIRPFERIIPQIDLFKLHHFDNPAKKTSLKALQVNLRAESVLEMPLPWDQPLTSPEQVQTLIEYNQHDVIETRRFAIFSRDAIEFRIGLMQELRGDVLNFSDSKLGSKILETRLGQETCYDASGPRQTRRDRIILNDIIFPYVSFRPDSKFNGILEWMRTQTLTRDDWSESTKVKTKGVFKNVVCDVGGLTFRFGTGGIHASLERQRIIADDDYIISDIDVTGLYPSIAIKNRLYPEHLGERFVAEYAKLPAERARHKKGTVQNAALKLAANGTYGLSNNEYSCFFDPQFTMAITINGQLMLCMLAERLVAIPTVQLIQVNTDGVSYRVHKLWKAAAEAVQKQWEQMIGLTLEATTYSRMWIRDVNNYVAESTNGKLKQKGAYWFPRKFPDDLINSAPPSWHKDFSPIVSRAAAVEHMVTGTDISTYIRQQNDPFNFCLRAKVNRDCNLVIGDREVQRTTRYYVAVRGDRLKKISPPAGPEGTYKRRNGLTDREYYSVLENVPPGTWDERIHTKNKSTYTTRTGEIQAGYAVQEANDIKTFNWSNVDYGWYVNKAEDLVI